MPAINFAECASNQRRGDHSGIDKYVVNLKSVSAPVVTRCIQRTDLAGEVSLETTNAGEQTSQRGEEVTSNAIRKCPPAMSSAPIVMVRVRPSARSAINPPQIGVR